MNSPFLSSPQAEQLRQHYMTKYDSEVADAHQALQPVLQNIKELKRKVRNPLDMRYSRRAKRVIITF